jgi:hypothetical protein
MFYVRIHKLDKATALGPNCGALTLVGDGLYIRRGVGVRVYRVAKLKKSEKRKNRGQKLVEIDQKCPKSPENGKTSPVFSMQTQLPTKLETLRVTARRPGILVCLFRDRSYRSLHALLLLSLGRAHLDHAIHSCPYLHHQMPFSSSPPVATSSSSENFDGVDVMLQSISSPRGEAASPPSPRCRYSKKCSYIRYLAVEWGALQLHRQPRRRYLVDSGRFLVSF